MSRLRSHAQRNVMSSKAGSPWDRIALRAGEGGDDVDGNGVHTVITYLHDIHQICDDTFR